MRPSKMRVKTETEFYSHSFGEPSWRLDADLEIFAGRGSINA